MPELDALYFVGLASRLAHILSAIVLVGGLFYLRVIVVPRRNAPPDSGDSAEEYFFGLRRRWALYVMTTAGLLIVSGLYNFLTKVIPEKFPPPYHMLFGIKFLLALVVIFAASIVAGKTDAAQRARRRMGMWLNLAIVCALLVVLIASTMRTFEGAPKDGGESAAAGAFPAAAGRA